MKEFKLRQELKTLKDSRRGQAQQHKIDVVMMITIMATMSGYQGYRAIGDFAIRYKKEIVEYLELEKEKMPSFATVRRVVMNIDHKKFGDIFTKWMRHYMKKNNSQWISVDGKAIKGTKQKEEDKKLAHLVSFFTSDSKEVIIARKTASKSNEIPLVQEMMEEFPLKEFVLTMDALHCQTKTLKAIKNSGNDYVVQVKENQKNS
jgi:hypothetical protein